MNQAITLKIDSLEHLRSTVRTHLRGRIYDFDVRREPQGLVLTGFARSYYAKLLAQQVVMRHADWPIARNEIEVDGR